MSYHKYYTIEEREKLYLMRNLGINIRKITAALHHFPSTICRGIAADTFYPKWHDLQKIGVRILGKNPPIILKLGQLFLYQS